MSELKKEELMELSVPQLKKYATGLEGADLELVNSVIVEKESRKDKIAKEANEKLAELNAAKKEIVEKEAAAKMEAAKAKEELKVAALEAKTKLLAEKEAAKAAALEAKAITDAAKEELKAAKVAAKMEADELKAAAKEAKLAATAQAKELSAERFAALQAEMIRRKEAGETMTVTDGTNKSATIKELYAQGLNNAEIAEASGIGRKMVCDIVWGIKQKEKEAEFLAAYRAKKEAEKAQTVSETV